MRKTLLALALTLTACNLAVGAYGALCLSTGGSRACGSTCQSGPNGICACEGVCTDAEMKWVGEAKGDDGGGGGEELMSD